MPQRIPRTSTSPASGRVNPSRISMVVEILEGLTLPDAGEVEDLDGGRLAGSVGSEQAEAFARLDREVEPGDGDHVAVALREAAATNRGHYWRGCCGPFLSGCNAALSS